MTFKMKKIIHDTTTTKQKIKERISENAQGNSTIIFWQTSEQKNIHLLINNL